MDQMKTAVFLTAFTEVDTPHLLALGHPHGCHFS